VDLVFVISLFRVVVEQREDFPHLLNLIQILQFAFDVLGELEVRGDQENVQRMLQLFVDGLDARVIAGSHQATF
jgi:hypothetical protein